MDRLPRLLTLATAAILLQGCVSLLPPDNAALDKIDLDKGYRVFKRKPMGEHNIILAFSGGGTRAAALSYGVLQELRDTQIRSADKPVRVLDEVDLISSVSGGSFTSAYYGLYGDDIFRNYEKDFLRKSIQSSLISNLLSPSYWFHAMFSGINRTDMAVDYYNRTVFHNATFADIPLDKRPFIEINATDLSSGAHVSFTQGYFDLFCSDLSRYPIARAVTASSGVPMMFPPVALKNQGDKCDREHSYLAPLLAKNATDSVREEELLKVIQSYSDTGKHPYIHLIDGGVSDNLGMRAVLERLEIQDVSIKDVVAKNPSKDVVVVVVNAEVKPAKPIDLSYQPPSMLQTAGALTDALIARYTVETRAVVKAQMEQYEKAAQEGGYDLHFYFVEVNFNSLESSGLQQYFNSLPTTLELSNEEIDNLIAAGRSLLRQSQPWQQFVARNHGELKISPDAKPACSLFEPTACIGH